MLKKQREKPLRLISFFSKQLSPRAFTLTSFLQQMKLMINKIRLSLPKLIQSASGHSFDERKRRKMNHISSQEKIPESCFVLLLVKAVSYPLHKGGDLHSTEVACLLLNQQPWVWFLVIPRIFLLMLLRFIDGTADKRLIMSIKPI